MVITKSQVKYIQSLGHKKFRDAEGVFVVEGPKITGELLREPNIRLRSAYGLQEWIDGLPAHAGAITAVDRAGLERLSALTSPNQVVAVFEKPAFPPTDPKAGVQLVLDGIQDPGNLGTIVRLADWFGIAAVVCSPDSADVFNSKAVQSTMGSIARIPVYYEDVAAVLRRDPGMPVYAAVLEGERLYGMERVRRGYIVIGNESRGIGPALQNLSSRRITIPRIGQAESLNAAVATGIILSHLVGT